MSDEQPPIITPPTEPPASGDDVTAKGSYQVPADYYSNPAAAGRDDRPGCPKWIPIGCGLGGCLFIILLFLGGSMLVNSKGGRVTVWLVSQMNEDVQRRLTVDVPAEQRAELSTVFKQIEELARAEKVTLVELQAVMQEYRTAVNDNRVDGVEARELVTAAQAVVASRTKK